MRALSAHMHALFCTALRRAGQAPNGQSVREVEIIEGAPRRMRTSHYVLAPAPRGSMFGVRVMRIYERQFLMRSYR